MQILQGSLSPAPWLQQMQQRLSDSCTSDKRLEPAFVRIVDFMQGPTAPASAERAEGILQTCHERVSIAVISIEQPCWSEESLRIVAEG